MKLRLAQRVRASKNALCASCGLEKPQCSNEKWYDVHVETVGRGLAVKCWICSYCRVRDQRVLRPCRELAVQSVLARVFSHLQLVNEHLMKHGHTLYLRRAITHAITTIKSDFPRPRKRVKSVPAEWTPELAGQLIRDLKACTEIPELNFAMPAFEAALRFLLQ